MKVIINKIKILDNRRQLRGIEELMQSIHEIGLLNPITVTEDLRLIAGYHRLEACKRLGWTEIEANIMTLNEIDAELAEIDENLIRNEFTILERSEALLRRKELYEAKYPEAKAYSSEKQRQRRKQEPAETVSAGFSTDTASKTGLTPRTIQQDVQIATKIAPEVRDQIREMPLADSKRDLLDLARMKPEQQRQVIQKIVAGETNKVKIAAQIVKQETLSPPPPTAGEYDVILADPPWRYEFTEAINRKVENQYPTMDLEEIKRVHVPSAPDAALFLWATAPKLIEALEVMKTWGFTYRTCAVWDKECIGMGYWFRIQHELLLVGTKGTFKAPPPPSRVSSVIRSPRQKHSRKPEIVYKIIEAMFPKARLLELFARTNNRPRWAVWGNELN